MEWYEFRRGYDSDLSIRMGLKDEEITLPEAYRSYGCYTQDMADELDRICQKYGLSLRGRSWDSRSPEDIFDAVGIDRICREDAYARRQWGYFCEDGSFHMEGTLTLAEENSPWPYGVDYQFISHMKASVGSDGLSIGQISDYTQWEYETAEGIPVLLALSEKKALILADREDFFVTVNILNPVVNDWAGGATRQMDQEALQAVADAFRFSYDPHKPDAEAIAQAEQRLEDQIQAALESAAGQDPYSHYDKSYDEWITFLIRDAYHPEKLGYVLTDLNGDGEPELLAGQDGYFEYAFTVEDGETKILVDPYMVGESYFYLCEGNIIAQVSSDHCLKNGLFTAIPAWSFGKLVGSQIQWERTLVYDPWQGGDNPWQEVICDENGEAVNTPLTQTEFYDILASYRRVYLGTKPLEQYPLEKPAVRDPERMYTYPMYQDYQELVLSRLEDPNEGFTYRFALLDLDRDGQEELIFHEDSICSVFTMTEGLLNKILSGYDLAVCGNGILRKTEYYGMNNYSITYFRVVDGNKTEIVEYLRYDADMSPGNPWLRSRDASGFDDSLIPVGEEKFRSIVESYPEEDILKPLESYPFA